MCSPGRPGGPGDPDSLCAQSPCQLDSGVTAAERGCEAAADWTVWVGASHIKRFTLLGAERSRAAPPSLPLSLSLSHFISSV